MIDFEHCYRAVRSRDGRFDGLFFTAVSTTGVYCRPSCSARTPKRENLSFYPTSAAAQEAGFRPCKRCRPDAAPGSPEWSIRSDLAARAVRLIADGVIERHGVSGLARDLGYSVRQLNRLLLAEVGAGPLAIARAHRAETARLLLETTAMPAAEVAYAAGFGSVRQFNDTIRHLFGLPPTALRAKAAKGPRASSPGSIPLRLAYRPPLDLEALFSFLGNRAVPGVEHFDGTMYSRVLRLPHGLALVSLEAASDAGHPHVVCELRLEDPRDFTAAVARCRRLLDLDADPLAVSEALGDDPLIAPLVAASPGRRMPGAADGPEIAIRAILGQQVSVPAARTLAARLCEAYGQPLEAPSGPLRRAFPSPEALARLEPTSLPMPSGRARALVEVARAITSGRLQLGPGADREEAERVLLALPGVGPWTAGYVRMRALSDPDAFLASDLGTRRALARLLATGAYLPSPRAALEAAKAWRPWRAYALSHLWASLEAQGLEDTRQVEDDHCDPGDATKHESRSPPRIR